MIFHIFHIWLSIHDPDRLSFHKIHTLTAPRALTFSVCFTAKLCRRNLPRSDDPFGRLRLYRLRHRVFIIITGIQQFLIIHCTMPALIPRQRRTHIHFAVHYRNRTARPIGKLASAFGAEKSFLLVEL